MIHIEVMRNLGFVYKHLETNTPHHTLLSLDDYHKQKCITCNKQFSVSIEYTSIQNTC